jgi:glucose-6-phosphate isomerase
MQQQKVNDSPEWADLARHAEEINLPENHLKHLVKNRNRIEIFSMKGAGLFFDYSRQRITEKTMTLLHRLAEKRQLKEKFIKMTAGQVVNTTENRAALHTAARCFAKEPIRVNGINVMPEIEEQRQRIKIFAHRIHSGKMTGSSGKPFTDAVVIGIGGSYLGTEFVSTALAAYADKRIRLHFLSNVDIDDFGRVVSKTDPEATLWVVISKSYTTAETLANTEQAYAYMKDRGIDPARHVVTVTAKGSPGDDPSNPVLETFHMFDFIGGRYSVSSAVGGVPLSLFLGYDMFERFLIGAEEMDRHAAEASCQDNLPLTSALISAWNNNFLHYSAMGIIPYAAPLAKLAPHIQQLSMESNGKSVDENGVSLEMPAGMIVFGEPGTNAQHSFFQLAHQGRPFPIEFIGVVNPQYRQYTCRSKGVTNHQELWANLISQPMALAQGMEHENPAKSFSGNRPSSTLVLKDLSPENVGRLLSFYEAKTVYEAFLWGINPFDQFGVELGKTMASGIRKAIAAKNMNPAYDTGHLDPISSTYLELMFSGKF